MENQGVWMTGHQPVFDFHSGLFAKISHLSALGGVFLVHDLDTLEEPGALGISFPLSEHSETIRLIERTSKKKLFIHGSVAVCEQSEIKKLRDLLFSRGRHFDVPRAMITEAIERVDRFVRQFKGESGNETYKSVSWFSVMSMFYVLPRIGIVMPDIKKVLQLSECISRPDWQDAMRHYIEQSPSPEKDFWLWHKERSERISVRPETTIETLHGFIEEGILVPKAVPLGCIARHLGYSLIRGRGQENYEREAGITAGGVSHKTVTSTQGVPTMWRKVFPNEFRPSALLLWILGGQFDEDKMVISE